MSRRTLFLGLLIGCGAIAAFVALRGRGADTTAPSIPGKAVNPDPDREARRAPDSTGNRRDRPELVVAAPPAHAPSMAFEDEDVDRAFSDRTATLVRDTASRAIAEAGVSGVRLGEIECRSQRCRLSLEADGAGLQEVMARLEDERGFYGKASELAMHDVVMGDDGVPRRVSMTLLFAPGGAGD